MKPLIMDDTNCYTKKQKEVAQNPAMIIGESKTCMIVGMTSVVESGVD